MPVRTGFPRTTHKWLKPLYDALDSAFGYVIPSGASGVPNAFWGGKGVQITQLGNATGLVGLYGFSGIAQVATGGLFLTAGSALGASGFQATGIGSSGLYTHLANAAFNGGSGTPYTITDIVAELKNLGALKP